MNCDGCDKPKDELTQRPDFPGVYEKDGTYRSVWLCGDCVPPRHEKCQCEDPCPTFECLGCGQNQPWCFGAADDLPDHCDDCWAKEHQDEVDDLS